VASETDLNLEGARQMRMTDQKLKQGHTYGVHHPGLCQECDLAKFWEDHPVPDKVQAYVELILDELSLHGEDFDETPRRVSEFLRSFRQGDPRTLAELLKTFTETSENVLVVQGNIPFSGLCAHHLVPFMGSAVVGYIPRKRKVGLSKLARLVQAAARIAPSTQEDITNLVADTIHSELEPIGCGVITKATHGCMSVRGVMAPDTWTQVNALRGQFLLNPAAKAEFMEAARP
jgi:GTP cyclohydrolase I